MPRRRAGAPRLIEWTGERCVPWADDIPVVYEHFHRYLWAQRLVGAKRVLDLGSGEGFGAALLADEATSVLGIDIAPDAVAHARINYIADNLEFRVASATDLSEVPDASIDVVVAFEVIEHVDDHATVLDEIARVLTVDGALIVSTPDRDAYAQRGGENPFHEHELTLGEFRDLLGGRFAALRLFSQRILEGSRIEALEGEHQSAASFQIERAGEEWQVGEPAAPLYLVAVASNGALPAVSDESTLSDFGLGLMRSVEREMLLARADHVDAEKRVSETQADAIDRLGAAASEVARLAEDRDQFVRSANEMAQLAEERRGAFEAEHETSQALARRLARHEQSVTWRIFQSLRFRLYRGLGGERSLLGRALSLGLRTTGRLTFQRRSESAAPATGGDAASAMPIVFPPTERPTASIVIPLHSGADLTEQCLRSILAASTEVAYEVILVDDDADQATKDLLSRVHGAHLVRNERNLNYLLSVNRGAAVARGEYIVHLNNDTEPQLGWLAALVARARSAPDIGVVAAKLVFPDGRLQEAGSMVWQDGTPWNYGHDLDAAAPEFNFVRPIDYGSAAALLVKTTLWNAIGGFDEQFAPAYWEDVDLCFAARAHGEQVVYEPRAVVVHHHGGSMGTDVEQGHKRYQVLNQSKFVAKWQDALRDQVPSPAGERVALAADRRRGPQVLVADHRVPRRDQDAGSLRMYHLMANLVELGCRVTFVPDNLHGEEPYTSELQSLGVEVLYGPISVYDRISMMSSRLRLAILSRPYVAPRYVHLVRRLAPNAMVAYDTVDLHFMREERRIAHSGDESSGVVDAFRYLELGLAHAADVTLVVSEDERQVIESLTTASALVVPLANEVWEDTPGPAGRAGVLFVGGFDHEPNVDAARYLALTIMPLVWRERPEIKLTVVGAHAPPAIRALEEPNVIVAGWVADLDPLLTQTRVSAAPLRYGAGVKGKVTQAMAAGLPVVATVLGAEGLPAVDGEDLFVADDPETFARRIVQLHDDDERWEQMSRDGRELVRRECSPEAQRVALERLVALSTERPTAPVTDPVSLP